MGPMQRRKLFTLAVAGAAGSLAAPAVLRAQGIATLADTMAGDTRFARFLDLISRGGMVETFRQAQPMTVFAPVDQAFLGAPAGLIATLTGQSGTSGNNVSEPERQRLGALINYHIVPGAFRSEALAGSDRRLRTVNGSDLALTGSGGSLSLQNPAPMMQPGGFGAAGAQVSAQPARVVQADIIASNGVIHAIDQVLWP